MSHQENPDAAKENETKESLSQGPTLERLLSFEAVSWPTEEAATPEDLKKRLEVFPQGIFLLSDQDKDVAQVTISPKSVPNFQDIKGFEHMRDLPANTDSKDLWVTNIARRRGEEFRGKGYALKLFNQVIDWAKENGYDNIQAGVTCDGYKEMLADGKVNSIEEYMQQSLNPALKVFVKGAQEHNFKFEVSKPIKDYWPINETSKGYGVLIKIYLKKED